MSHIEVNLYSQKSVDLDPGFGSSNFDVCITELIDGVINVLHAEEYQRPDFNRMIEITTKLLDQPSLGSTIIIVLGTRPFAEGYFFMKFAMCAL